VPGDIADEFRADSAAAVSGSLLRELATARSSRRLLLNLQYPLFKQSQHELAKLQKHAVPGAEDCSLKAIVTCDFAEESD